MVRLLFGPERGRVRYRPHRDHAAVRFGALAMIAITVSTVTMAICMGPKLIEHEQSNGR